MKLRDMASVIRSKNAGPFIQSFDVFFEDETAYRRVKDSNVLNSARVAELYRVDPVNVLGVRYLDVVRGIKIAFIKPGVASGDPGVTDMYGCQQHAPLLDIDIS